MLRGRCNSEPAVTVRDPTAASGRWTWWNSRTDGESPDGRQHVRRHDGCRVAVGGERWPPAVAQVSPEFASRSTSDKGANTTNDLPQVASTRPASPSAAYQLQWLEIIGVIFGLASAVLGMRRTSGPGPSASSATSCSSSSTSARRSAPADRTAALRPVRTADLLHHRPASTAGGAGTQVRHADGQDPLGSGDHPALGHDTRAGLRDRHLARRRRRRAVGLRDARRRMARTPLVLLVPMRGSSSGPCSRRTRWPAAGTSSGWPGSGSTSSASRCCSAQQTHPYRRPLRVLLDLRHLRVHRVAAGQPHRDARREPAGRPTRPPPPDSGAPAGSAPAPHRGIPDPASLGPLRGRCGSARCPPPTYPVPREDVRGAVRRAV